MAGYSIQQLLEWTCRDHLIDTYSMGRDGTYLILVGGREYVLNDHEAKRMLIGLLRDSGSGAFRGKGGSAEA